MMMKKITLIVCMISFISHAQVTFDFKTDQSTLGWIKSGGASGVSVVADGMAIAWDANKAPKVRNTNLNVDASTYTTVAVTVINNSSEAVVLKYGHYKGNTGTVPLQTSSTKFIATDIDASTASTTYYYDLTHAEWVNYNAETLDDADSDFDHFDIIFQAAGNTNLATASSGGNIIISKIVFYEKTTTYDGFAQNAGFSDDIGSLSPWSLSFTGSGAATAEFTEDGDGTTSAAKITLDATADNSDKVSFWCEYVYDFTDNGLSDVSASTNIDISYSVKKATSATAVEIQPRWLLTYEDGGTQTQFRTGDTETVTDTYATQNTYKAIGSSSRTYTSIKLGFFVRGATSDVVYIDNIKTSIDGQTLTESGDLENAQAEIAIYPNPVQNQLNIASDKAVKEVQIINSLGKLVYKAQGNSSQIGTDSLPGGIYMVTVLFEDGQTHTQRIIKQ